MEPKNMLDKATPPPLPKTTTPNSHNIEENYGILDWFKKGMKNYTNLSGRARRKEFWYFILVHTGLLILATVLDSVILGSEKEFFYAIVALGLFLPSIAVGVRRLHDTDRSGWWLLVFMVPLIGIIALLIFFAIETNSETNQWGPPAK